MYLSHKVRIFPSEDQQNVLWDLAEKCRLIYNFALRDRIQNWRMKKDKPKEEMQLLTYNKQSNQLPALKKQYPEYKWVYSKVLQNTLRRLDADYKSFYALWKKGDTNARPPNFKGWKYFTTLSYNQSGFKMQGNCLTLSHKHPTKCKLAFNMSYMLPIDTKVKQMELFRDRQKRWFVSFSYEYAEIPYVDNGKYQAIDLGISNLVSAVNLDSKFIQIKNRRADLFWKKKLKVVQSKRDHCKRYSRRWKRYHQKYASMKRKGANQMRDFQHKISKQIVTHTKANTIIVGDLNVKQMAKKKKTTKSPRLNKANKTLNHSMQNTGSLSRFIQFLTYKATKIGKKVIQIDESYTTQVCCQCGLRKKRSLAERTIFCQCGNQLDRDLNSAINIMKKYLYLHHSDNLLHQPDVNTESFLHQWNGFTTIHSLFRTKSENGLVGSPLL